MSSTDGTMGVVPTMSPSDLVSRRHLRLRDHVDGSTVTVRRDGDVATETTATAPGFVSVPDQSRVSLATRRSRASCGQEEAGRGAHPLRPRHRSVGVGLDAAWTSPLVRPRRPPRSAGEIVTDEGDGGVKLAEFLASKKLV